MKTFHTLLRMTVLALLLVVANPSTAHVATLSADTLQTDATRATSRILRGDVNNDGDRSIADVTKMVNHILISSDDFNISIGDMDNDGEITVADVMILVKIILGSHYTDYEDPDLYISDAEGGDPATGM